MMQGTEWKWNETIKGWTCEWEWLPDHYHRDFR